MRIRLGGWWRLWIIGAGIYGAVVAIFQWEHINVRRQDIKFEKRHVERLSDRSLEILIGSKASSDKAHSVNNREDKILVKMPNGAEFPLPSDTTKEQVAEVSKDYDTVLESLASERRFAAVFQALAIWLVPTFVVLGLGYAVRWIYRGFTQPDR
jgi:hypothetical protein